jgi:hypothetical protein
MNVDQYPLGRRRDLGDFTYRYDVDGRQDARREAGINREQAHAMYDASNAVWDCG